MGWHDLLAGYGGPFLAILFGVAGVVLGRYIAQGIHKDGEEKLSHRVNIALTVLFSLAVVGYVRGNPTTDPLRLLGYGSAAGFIGLPVLEFLADQMLDRFKGAFDGFMNPNKRHLVVDEEDIQSSLKALDKLPEVKQDGPSK